jgi:signal peptidase I
MVVTFLFQAARIYGQAIFPTLNAGDRVVVNRRAYRISGPQPRDIVMLRYPVDPQTLFVEGIVAREGDTVRIVDGRWRDDSSQSHVPRSTDGSRSRTRLRGYPLVGALDRR